MPKMFGNVTLVFFLFLSFQNKIETEPIKQLTRNETGGGIFTPIKLASRSQFLVRQNTHNYLGPVKDSNLESLVSVSDSLIHFWPMFSFYTPWKRFSDIFRGYRKGTLAWNGLILVIIRYFGLLDRWIDFNRKR